MSRGAIESAANAFGVPSTMELGGKTFVLQPIAAEVYGRIERHLESTADNPFAIAKKNMPMFANDPKVQAEMIAVAMTQARQVYRASIQEVAAYMNSFEGTCFVVWCSIRGDTDNEDDYLCSFEFVKESMIQMVDDAMKQDRGLEEVLSDVHSQLDQVSGEGLAGNSPGPTSTGSNSSPTQQASTSDQSSTDDKPNS